jgi:hypothetical protein
MLYFQSPASHILLARHAVNVAGQRVSVVIRILSVMQSAYSARPEGYGQIEAPAHNQHLHRDPYLTTCVCVM